MDLIGRGRWPDKTEDDVKTYSIEWIKELGSGSISSVSWESFPSKLTFTNPTFSGSTTSVDISGGTGGTDYVVVCQITKSDSKTATVKPRLKVLADEEVY